MRGAKSRRRRLVIGLIPRCQRSCSNSQSSMLYPRHNPPGLDKAKKCAVRRRGATLIADNGEVYIKRKGRKVKVVTFVADKQQILRSCHTDPTSGHFVRGGQNISRPVLQYFIWGTKYCRSSTCNIWSYGGHLISRGAMYFNACPAIFFPGDHIFWS